MRLLDARKLRSRDQVTLKETGEVGYVLSARVAGRPGVPVVVIEAEFPQSGRLEVSHLEIR